MLVMLWATWRRSWWCRDQRYRGSGKVLSPTSEKAWLDLEASLDEKFEFMDAHLCQQEENRPDAGPPSSIGVDAVLNTLFDCAVQFDGDLGLR